MHEKITPGDTATGITAGIRKPDSGLFAGQQATSAYITVENESITFAMDGSVPTALAGTNVGHVLAAGASFWLTSGTQINNFKCIDSVSGSAGTVKVTCLFE